MRGFDSRPSLICEAVSGREAKRLSISYGLKGVRYEDGTEPVRFDSRPSLICEAVSGREAKRLSISYAPAFQGGTTMKSKYPWGGLKGVRYEDGTEPVRFDSRPNRSAVSRKNIRGCGEMADALALGASGAIRGGSSPLIPTK
jgi:hypothetical protein